MGTELMPRVSAPIATKSPTPRSLQDRFADITNVKDFGAIGDGETDDTEAFAAAVASISAECIAGADTVQLVFIPTGTYLLTSNVDGFFFSFGGVELIGEGTIQHYNLFNILTLLNVENNSDSINSINTNITTINSTISTLQNTITTLQGTTEELQSKITEIEEAYVEADEELSNKIDEIESSSSNRTLKVEYISSASSTSQSTSTSESKSDQTNTITGKLTTDGNSTITVDYSNTVTKNESSSDSD